VIAHTLPSIWLLLVSFAAITLAYAIFALAGFGSVFITAPALAQMMPLSIVVPVLALVDCGAATLNGWKLGRKIVLRELVLLIPLMIAGSYLGAKALLVLPARPMMIALGVFVIVYALQALLWVPGEARIGRGWVIPIGALGGIFSGMFGSGGFIYAMYLTRRLADKDEMRATQSALIGLSTLTRAVIFFAAGLYTDLNNLLFAVACLPAMALGTWLGHRVTLTMSREQFLKTIHSLLIVSGGALLVRGLMLPR